MKINKIILLWLSLHLLTQTFPPNNRPSHRPARFVFVQIMDQLGLCLCNNEPAFFRATIKKMKESKENGPSNYSREILWQFNVHALYPFQMPQIFLSELTWRAMCYVQWLWPLQSLKKAIYQCITSNNEGFVLPYNFCQDKPTTEAMSFTYFCILYVTLAFTLFQTGDCKNYTQLDDP